MCLIIIGRLYTYLKCSDALDKHFGDIFVWILIICWNFSVSVLCYVLILEIILGMEMAICGSFFGDIICFMFKTC